MTKTCHPTNKEKLIHHFSDKEYVRVRDVRVHGWGLGNPGMLTEAEKNVLSEPSNHFNVGDLNLVLGIKRNKWLNGS